MKLPFESLPDDEPPPGRKEFLARMKDDPGFAEKMRRQYEAALALRLSPDTEELHKTARAALAALRHHQGAWHCLKALEECRDAMESSRFSLGPDEIRGLLAKTEEAVDHLLDISEPERTRFVAKVTSMQDDLRRLLANA